jgi:hypothetical protein
MLRFYITITINVDPSTQKAIIRTIDVMVESVRIFWIYVTPTHSNFLGPIGPQAPI